MKVSTAWILFKIIDEVDTSTVNCQLSTVHCESAKFQLIGQGAIPGMGHEWRYPDQLVRVVSGHWPFKFQFITMPQAGFSVEQHGTALVDITKSRCYFANCLLHFLIFVV